LCPDFLFLKGFTDSRIWVSSAIVTATLVPVYHLSFRVGATAIAAAADSTINFWPERLHKVTLTLTHSVVSFILENSIS
jgi:hypothetical protein